MCYNKKVIEVIENAKIKNKNDKLKFFHFDFSILHY